MTADLTSLLYRLLTQLPSLMVSLMKWKELETMVCGNPNVDVELLQSATEYSGYAASDNVIVWYVAMRLCDFVMLITDC